MPDDEVADDSAPAPLYPPNLVPPSWAPSGPRSDGGAVPYGSPAWAPPSSAVPAPQPRPSWWRRPLTLTAALVVLAAAAASGAWLVATSGSPSSSHADATHASRLASASVGAALASGSFHYVSTSSGGGVRQATVGDAGKAQGRQVITLNGDTFDVRVIGQACYFQGDAPAMVENLGISPSDAATNAGKWVSLASGDQPYQSVYAAVTTSSALDDNITFAANTQLPQSTIDGIKVIGLRGPMRDIQGSSAKGTATLYVTAKGKHLPVRYVEHGTVRSGTTPSALDFRIDFSSWGEAVTITAPTGAVPFSSVNTGGGTISPTPGTTVVA